MSNRKNIKPQHQYNWVMRSEEFYISSRELYFNGYFEPCLINAQISLELFLKGLYVQNGKNYDSSFDGHNLESLYEDLVKKGVVEKVNKVKITMADFNYNMAVKYPEWNIGKGKYGIDFKKIESLDYAIDFLRKKINFDDEKCFGIFSTIARLLNYKPNMFESGKYKWLVYKNKYISSMKKYGVPKKQKEIEECIKSKKTIKF